MTERNRIPISGQAGSLALPHMSPQLPDLSSLRALSGGDLSEHFKRLEEITRRRTETVPAPSALVLLDFVALSVEDSLELDEEGADLLDDARANISLGKHTMALEQLAHFLEISPGHPEARYLQAYCHYQLGGLMTALGILRPMRDEPLAEDKLAAGVRELRTTLRRALTPGEVTAFLDTYPRDPHPASDRLRQFLELAPEEPEPWYLLAVTQALRGGFESALRTARDGSKAAEGDTRQLRALAGGLEAAIARSLARAAIHALFDGAYRRARAELASLGGDWREIEVLRDLDAFLVDLCQRRHSPANTLPAPRGPADHVDRLSTLIFDEVGQTAVELLNAGRFAEAERVLAEILHIISHFPPANYLYAFCLCVQGREPKRAIAAAEIAARDPSLPDAHLLLRAAKELPQIQLIKAAFEEYNATMKSVTGKLSSNELAALKRTMEGLRNRLSTLRLQATSPQSAERVRDLAQAVDRRLAEIDQAMQQVSVSALVQAFNTWATQVAGRSTYGRPALSLDDRTVLTQLARQAGQLQHTVTDQRARTVLQDMLSTIDRISR